MRKRDQEIIVETLRNNVYDELDDQLCTAQINWIKLGAYALHLQNVPADDILVWIAQFKHLYRTNARLKTAEDLTNFLDRKMEEVFGENGFPEEFVQSFREIGKEPK